MAQAEILTVFYDGACPLCEREIAFYRGQNGAERISWVDVSRTSEDEIAPGLTKDMALARFHVMKSGGSLVSGGRAFAELWVALPAFRLVGRIARKGPLPWILDRAYGVFLRLRPRLQAMVPMRRARASTSRTTSETAAKRRRGRISGPRSRPWRDTARRPPDRS